MADTSLESKINELEARYLAAYGGAECGTEPFQPPRRPRLFGDLKLTSPRSPLTVVSPITNATASSTGNLINGEDDQLRSETAELPDRLASITPLEPINDQPGGISSRYSSISSSSGVWSSQAVTPVTPSMTSSMGMGGGSCSSPSSSSAKHTVISTSWTLPIIAPTPLPSVSQQQVLMTTSAQFLSEQNRSPLQFISRSNSSQSQSVSRQSELIPVHSTVMNLSSNGSNGRASRSDLELGTLASVSTSPSRAARPGLDLRALRTSSPMAVPRKRTDCSDSSTPSPCGFIARPGSDSRMSSSASPCSSAPSRTGLEFRNMSASSSSPSPGHASRAGLGFQMTPLSFSPGSTGELNISRSGFDFRTTCTQSPISRLGLDHAISSTPSANGVSILQEGGDSTGNMMGNTWRTNMASTPSPVEFVIGNPARTMVSSILSSPGGSGCFNLGLNGQPRRRHAINLTNSTPGNVQTPPKTMDSIEIDLKYTEIMKQAGILTIDARCIPTDISELVPLGDLGHGTCGQVVKMMHPGTGHMMAVKQMRRSGSCEENKRIIMDLDVVIKSHSCPFIVRCIGTFITSGDVWICMELMATCLDKLLKRMAEPIPECILGKVTVATVNALHYLKENHGVIHRDVKPSNILLDEQGQIKLCDFGISGRLVDSKANTRSAGCAAYMSPERIDPPDPTRPDYDIRADVWSLGLSLVELATGEFPYKNCSTDFEVLTKVLQDDPPALPSGKGFSMDFSSLVRACLTKDYRLRPKYQQLLEHNFVKRYTSLNVDVAQWYADTVKRIKSRSLEAPPSSGAVADN